MKPNQICEICGRAVSEKQGDMGWSWFINAAIVGGIVELHGHKTCLENVNRRVVIPQRLRLVLLQREGGK